MADVLRSCSKTACRWPAASSLSYRYATRQVWLLDLAATRDPSLYDLCPHHADNLVVPKGWDRVDDRTPQEVMVEPSAFDRAEEAARRRQIGAAPVDVPAGGHRNRYAHLVEQLPRLAAEAAQGTGPVTIHAGPTVHAAPPAAADHAPAAHVEVAAVRPLIAQEPPLPPLHQQGDVGGRAPTPVPSRELAPAGPVESGWSPPPQQPAQPAAVAEEPLPGQLAIPVDDLTEGADGTDGVVLSFELAGSRRRTPRP